MISHWLSSLNELTGLFLLILCVTVSSLARSVGKLASDVECLHEDYDRITDAHEKHQWEMEQRRDDMIAEAAEKRKSHLG